MDLSKFYYQYVDVPVNKTEVDEFLSRYPILKSRFERMNVKELSEILHTTFAWFDSHQMKVSHIFYINHAAGFRQDIHVDYNEPGGPELALNILLNETSKNSITRIYDLNEGQNPANARSSEHNLGYRRVTTDQAVCVQTYKSTHPVLLNIVKPHSAWNCTTVNRGLLTFRFEEDPIFLIK